MHCAPSSSSGHVKVREKGFSSPPLQCLSLSVTPPTCLKPRHNPHSFMAYHNDDRGRGDKPSLPLPLINTPSLGGGGGDGRMKRKKKERRKRTKQKRKKRQRKIGENKEKNKQKRKREGSRENKKKKREKQGRQTPWSSTIFFLYQLRYNTHEPPSLCFLPTQKHYLEPPSMTMPPLPHQPLLLFLRLLLRPSPTIFIVLLINSGELIIIYSLLFTQQVNSGELLFLGRACADLVPLQQSLQG